MRLRSAIVVPALLICLLAGCGAPVDGTASSDGSTPTPAPTTSAAPTTTDAPTSSPAPDTTEAKAAPKPSSSGSGAVSLLPWPTAAPTRLQAAVDSGAQPWLLDPSDLADSYVSATYGWTNADATAEPGGTAARTTVDVRNANGTRRTLTCAQPGRKGAGGIWLVTADTTV